MSETSPIDVTKLLEEVSSDNPCGENLEYDPAFTELERATKGKSEQQFGDTLVAAEEPEWFKVRDKAIDLLYQSKDLRVVVYLARALLYTNGLIGLSEGLALLKDLLNQYWDTVHPQLDPDDNNDPTLRVNIIASLCDPKKMLRAVRELPLVSSRALGRYSLRDIQIAAGTVTTPPDEETPPDISLIDAAFRDTNLEVLQTTANSVSESIEHVQTLESLLTERVGATQAPDLNPLASVLQETHQILVEQLTRRGALEEVHPDSTETAAKHVATAAGTVIEEIKNRDDVRRLLEKICDYYQRQEPSSPVPLLLQRAKRLVAKDFMEILHDLVPDGVSQAERFRGSESGE